MDKKIYAVILTSLVFMTLTSLTLASSDQKPKLNPVLTAASKKNKADPTIDEPYTKESFVTDSSWKFDGLILSEYHNKTYISQGDTVHLDFGAKKGAYPGIKCAVYRKTTDLKDYTTPKGRRAVVVTKIGTLLITEVNNNTSTAKVITSNEPIKPGDMIRIVKE